MLWLPGGVFLELRMVSAVPALTRHMFEHHDKTSFTRTACCLPDGTGQLHGMEVRLHAVMCAGEQGS